MQFVAIFELHGIDPINGILLPTIISIIVGVPLAIYTGLYTSRIMEFSRIKAEIAKRLRDYYDLLWQSESSSDLVNKYLLPLIHYEREAHRLKQKRFARTIFRTQLYLEERIHAVEHSKDPRPAHTLSSDEWQNMKHLVFLELHRSAYLYASAIEQTKPDYFACAGFTSIDDYLRRLMRFMRRLRCYLDGR